MKQLIAILLFSSFSFLTRAAGQVTVFEDFIYWHASQQSTSPWAYVQTINVPPAATYTEPNVYFKWHAGLKLGIQYEQPSLLDAKLYWTYFSTKTHEGIIAAPNEIIIPEFFNGFTTLNLFNRAQLDWKIIMNMVDADLGHTFNPLDSISVRPFVGIKGGTINQSIHSAWQEQLFNSTLYSATEDLKNNFYGVGPSFGIDTVWRLKNNVRIRGDFSTAFLWGHWDIQDTYFRPATLLGLIPETTISSHTNNAMLGAFMARYFLGLEWTLHTKVLVTLKAGYEMQFWSNQLRLPVFQALPIHGDLTLQGATCGISINL